MRLNLAFQDKELLKDLRERFYKAIRKHPRSLQELCKVIGISYPTMLKYAHDRGDLEFKSMVKIEKWIESVEKE